MEGEIKSEEMDKEEEETWDNLTGNPGEGRMERKDLTDQMAQKSQEEGHAKMMIVPKRPPV